MPAGCTNSELAKSCKKLYEAEKGKQSSLSGPANKIKPDSAIWKQNTGVRKGYTVRKKNSAMQKLERDVITQDDTRQCQARKNHDCHGRPVHMRHGAIADWTV